MGKSIKEQVLNKCIHFNGLKNQKCDAGKVYDEVDKDCRVPYRACLPCFKDTKHMPEGATKAYCHKMQFPTEEEAEREEKSWDDHIKKMTAAFEVVGEVKRLPAAKKGGNFVRECPVCKKGKLAIQLARVNLHACVRCSTEGCVAFME